ncbi:MAG: AraC family transcriptional regulator [Polyangiaceae bacterium]|nr:AraC family transcriptional regulator [Polyangiaceae bacterium]
MKGVRLVRGPIGAYERLPHGEVELIARAGDGATSLYVSGARATALRKPTAMSSAIVIRFHAAGAYPFFGVPMRALTDRFLSLDELWKGEPLPFTEKSDVTADDVARLVETLARRLASGRVYDPATARGARRALRRIREMPRLPQVVDLASDIGASERQLRRAFDDVVGLSPKQYLRIVRFRRALAAARRKPRTSWCAIAANTGYFDQAHLIADFRALTGKTPNALVLCDRGRRWDSRYRPDKNDNF